MGWSTFAVLCGILTFAYSDGSNSWQMIQPMGKATNNAAPTQPVPYSSIVYLINEAEIFCFGILIAPKYALSDGSCGEQIIIFDPSNIASSTKVFGGDTTLPAGGCEDRYINEVIYEKPGDPVEKSNGLLIADLTRSPEFSPHASLAYLPAENIKLIGEHAAAVALDENLHLKPEDIIINGRTGVILTADHLYSTSELCYDVQPGAPVFLGSNLVGISGILLNELTYYKSWACLKNIQLSYDFITNFASCGGEFDESRNDPGHSLIGGASSSTA